MAVATCHCRSFVLRIFGGISVIMSPNTRSFPYIPTVGLYLHFLCNTTLLPLPSTHFRPSLHSSLSLFFPLLFAQVGRFMLTMDLKVKMSIMMRRCINPSPVVLFVIIINPCWLSFIMQECSAYESCDMVHKCCTDCKTTKTPLWRAGPAGPKVMTCLSPLSSF